MFKIKKNINILLVDDTWANLMALKNNISKIKVNDEI